MANDSLISVVIPIYNTEKYLNSCIESVLNQTYKNVEIILVDDASPDGAPQLCDEWSSRHDFIKVIHKTNEGLGYTRNAGLNMATGEYVCFLDSDDTLDSDTFEGCAKVLDEGADACFYGRKTGKADGTYSVNSNIPKKLEYSGDEVKKEFATTYLGLMPNQEGQGYIQASACCAMYRRSVIEEHKIRFLSERDYLSEDTLFNLDVCKYAKKIVIIPKDYYNYTYNGESLTKKYNPNRFNQLKKYYGKLLECKAEFEEADNVNIRVPYQLYIYLRHTIEYEVKSYKLNGLKRTSQRIKDICNDEFIQEHIKEIDKSLLSKKRGMLLKWIENKNAMLIMIYYIIK